MRLHWLIVFFLFAVLTLNNSNSSDVDKEEEIRHRVKRTIFLPTAHPSRLSVALQSVQTEIFSIVIRWFIGFERRFLDVMSADGSQTELATYMVSGFFRTFGVIFLPLVFIKFLILPLLFTTPIVAVRKRRSIEDPHLEFELPNWMTEMEHWIETRKPKEKRYRCCLYEEFVRCFPLLPKYAYPWNNPCPRENDYRDIGDK